MAKKPSDERPKPGDIVLLRGSSAQVVWAEPRVQRAGWVQPGALGLVISSSHQNDWKFYAYVLWSVPSVMGWIEDGFLRKV